NAYGAGTLVTDASGNITVSSGGGAGGPYLPLAGGTMNSGATITMSGNLNLTYAYPRINLTDTNHNSDYSIINNDGAFSIYDQTNNSHRLSISAAGNVTFAGRVMADTHFQSSDTNATLSATGTGNIYLRPNGYSTTTGQVYINTSGNATFSGDVTAPSFIGKLMGGATGAPDATIWCVSGDYTDWGIFYDENTPDVIQFKAAGTTTASISLDNGDYTGRNATFSGSASIADDINITNAGGVIQYVGSGSIGAQDNFFVGGATTGTDHTYIGDSGRNVSIYNSAYFTVESGDVRLLGTGRIQGIDSVLVGTDAANKTYVDAHDGGAGVYLPLAGGTMLGDILMQDELLNFKSGGSATLPQFTGLRSATDLNNRSWTTEGGWAYTTFDNGTSNQPSSGLHNANGLLSFNTHADNYMAQIAMTTNTGKLWHRSRNGSSWLTWYQIYSTQDFSTTNISNWNTAYNNMVTAVAVTGTTTKTITLTQQDGGTVSNTFTAGVVQSVTTGNSNTITIGGSTANPIVQASTAAVSLSSPNLATGAQIQTAINTAIDTIPSGLAFEGNWNASTDSPDLSGASPDNGQFWIVSVAGSTNLSGITDWKVGDWAIYVATGAGTDGWQKVDNTSTLSGAGTVNALPLWTGTTSLGTSRFTQTSTKNIITGPGNTASDYSLSVTNAGNTEQFYIHGTGEVVVTQNYFYVAASQGMYSNGLARFRGGVTNDQGNLNLGGSGSIGNLTLTSNTAASFAGTLSVGSITNATTDTDRFLVSDGSVIKYRTGAQLRSDIGAGTGSGNVTGGGSAGRVAYWTSGSNIGSDEAFLWDATNDMLDTRTLLVSNARVSTGQKYSPGHYTPGETIWEIDPTWSDKQLKELFNNNNVSWSTNSIAQDAPGGYAIYINGAVSVGGVYGSGFPFIPVDNDGVYYMECYIKNVGVNTHYMGSNEFNATFTSTGGNPGSFGYWVMSNTNPGTSWTKVSGYIGGFDSSQTGKFELATKYWTPQALFNYTNSSGTRACYISGWKAVRVDAPGNRYFDNNVNIGLNSLPTTRLQVSSSSANGIDISKDTADGNNSGRLFFSTDTASEGVSLMNVNGIFQIRTGAQPNSTSGNIKFSITAAGNATFAGTGDFGGSVNIASGGDLILTASSGSTDTGDIVFYHTGAEAHRLWSGTNTLNYRTGGGTTYQLLHSGNYTDYNAYTTLSASTRSAGDNTTNVATTEFVTAAVATGVGAYLPLVGGTMANTNLVTNMNADLLDGISSASFLRSDATDIASQRIQFKANDTNNWDTIATSTGSLGGIEIFNNGAGNDAFMAFHAGNDFAFYFGIDADNNQLSVGGWSMGANKYKVWNESNDGAGSGLDADLLDGQQGSYYATAASLNNYLPKANPAFTGTLTGPAATISNKIIINSTNAPNNLAILNIGYSGGGETRSIDLDGGWGGGESKSITATHGSASTNIVGQMNFQHNGPGSSIRFGKLYHSGDSSTYTMQLVSTSSTTADLTVAGNMTTAGDITVSGGDITLGGTGRIQGIDTVSATTDAANKAYVDSLSADDITALAFTGTTTQTLTATQRDTSTLTASFDITKIKAGGNGPSAENLNTVANSVSVGELEYRGFNSNSSNIPPVSDNANGVITVGQHSGNYNAQLAFSSDGNMYWRDNPSTGFGSWNKILDANNTPNGPFLPLSGGTMTGTISMGTQIFATAGNYGRGVFGVYSPSRYQHVWSMGTAYKLADAGTSTGVGGNLYGLAWSYNPDHDGVGNNAQAKAGLNHQLLLMQNGTTTFAAGSGMWTSGTITADNGQIVLNGTGRIQGVDTVSASTDAANKAYVDAHPGTGGTVTSVATGGGLDGGTITTTGTIEVEYDGVPTNIIQSGFDFTGDTVVPGDYMMISDPGQTTTNRRIGYVTVGDLPKAPQTTFTRDINASTWTMLCTVNGDRLASIVDLTITGTSNGVVMAASFEIIVNHYQDIHVRSMSGDYVNTSIRITSNNNEDFSIEAKAGGGSTTSVEVCVFPRANEAITPTTTDPGYTGEEYIHTAVEGWRFGGEDGNTTSARVSINGALSIGTTFPGKPLTVNGTIRAEDNNSGDYIDITNDGSVSGHSKIETSNGNLIIDPSGILDVQANAVVQTSNGVGDFYIGNYATAKHFRFHTNNSQTYFDMNCGQINWREGSSTRYYFYPSTANMTINGTLTQNSDSRVKENVVEIDNCISKVQAMRGVYYNRTDFNTEVTKVGVIAQEVEAVLPELILEASDTGLKSVAYAELTAVLINAIKEQQEIIDDLKTRIIKLEK
ncbi:pyocin knob domain-containing S74 family peptidase, partial [Flavobacteriaceae bacterium]|nr:pyocin knob domain-containing S74 family peptidase [Flavobacteriaceae bacterium]